MSALRKKMLKSPSHSVTPSLDTPSGVGLGASQLCFDEYECIGP